MLTPDAKEALRRRVMAAIEQGMKPSQAVRTFRVSRTAVYNWTQAVREGGKAALKAKPLGRPRRSRLAGHQAATVVRMITAGCPDQLKLPFALWTRPAVQQLLAERFGQKVSLWTVGRYLAGWGLTPQKPIRRAYQQNPAAVQRWLVEEYPAIRGRARREKAEIHWGDQMGLRSEHHSGTTYGRRGQTPVVGCSGRRFGCNMMSTITNRGVLRFMVFRQRFTSPVMIEFLTRLLRSVEEKVFLIVDRHPVHRASAVRRWFEAHRDRIELFYLPDYSPELNPDELLNQETKSHAGRQRPHDQAEMMRQLRRHLRSTQRQPGKVQRYFDHDTVAYAAH